MKRWKLNFADFEVIHTPFVVPDEIIFSVFNNNTLSFEINDVEKNKRFFKIMENNFEQYKKVFSSLIYVQIEKTEIAENYLKEKIANCVNKLFRISTCRKKVLENE